MHPGNWFLKITSIGLLIWVINYLNERNNNNRNYRAEKVKVLQTLISWIQVLNCYFLLNLSVFKKVNLHFFLYFPKVGIYKKCLNAKTLFWSFSLVHYIMGAASQVALVVKNLPANAGAVRDRGLPPWVGKIPWRRARHSCLVWRIP